MPWKYGNAIKQHQPFITVKDGSSFSVEKCYGTYLPYILYLIDFFRSTVMDSICVIDSDGEEVSLMRYNYNEPCSNTISYIHSYNIENYHQYFNCNLLSSSGNEVMTDQITVEVLEIILNMNMSLPGWVCRNVG